MNRKYCRVMNQYGREIGYALDEEGETSEQLLAAAKAKAAVTISKANPNWKWRIAKIQFGSYIQRGRLVAA